MRLINGDLPYAPRACSVSNRIDGEFVDFNKVIDGLRGPHRLYLKREVVEEAAELCGMIHAREVDKLKGDLAALDAKIEQLAAFVEAHEKAAELAPDLEHGEGI